MSTRSLRYNTLNRHLPKSRLASTDRDALAFLEAAAIVNGNQQQAIVELVRSLKRTGLWSKMKALYPFIGGTAAAHKWNLKDVRDVDAAFRLSFVGGWTHSANGAKGDGTSGYANTFMNPLTHLSQTSASAFIYNRENRYGGTTINDYGCAGAFANLSRFSNTGYYDCWGSTNGTSRVQVNSVTDRRGLLGSSRTSRTSLKAFRNGAQIGSTATGSTPDFSGSSRLIMSAYNTNTAASPIPTNYSDMSVGFFCFGDGLTDTEATALYNIVDLYQKRLGRAV